MNAFDRLILIVFGGAILALIGYAVLFGDEPQPQPVYVNVNQSQTVDQQQQAPQYIILPTLPPMPTLAPVIPAPQVMPVQPPVEPFNQPASQPIGYQPPAKAGLSAGAPALNPAGDLLYRQAQPGQWQKAGQP